MRSRAARFIACVLGLAALGGTAFYLQQEARALDRRQAELRLFEARAREVVASIGSAGAAQRSYVASGQSSAVWMPQVKALSNQTAAGIDDLRGLATSTEARRLLLDASASLTEFTTIDKQAADYLAGEQTLMASDVIFSAAAEAAADVEQQVEAARAGESQAVDTFAALVRQRQRYAAAGGASTAAIILLCLGLARAPRRSEAPAVAVESYADALPLQIAPVEPAPVAPAAPVAAAVESDAPPRDALALAAAAEICTSFGRVQDLAGLKRALADAATALDAAGLVVWLGNAEGADLQAVVAHGYSDHVLALMRPVQKQADNAAATAYRTGALQIVPAKPGTSLGAVVAPILAADGCIGALTAEIRDNGEVSDTVHAMATIFASQLSGVLASSTSTATSSTRAASA